MRRNVMASPAFKAAIALVLVLVLGFIFNGDGAFLKLGTHRDAIRQISVYGILACGMTLVVIMGGIDLAVGSVLALTAVVFSLTSIHWGWSPWLAVPFCLLTGAVCGALSGSLAAWGRLQPFIATLALMVATRGVAKWVSGGEKISTAVKAPDGSFQYVDVPAIFHTIDSRVLGGNVSTVSLIFLLCFVATWFVLTKTTWGRYLYAIGGNERAARYSGVRVERTKLMAYMASGVFAAIAGLVQAAQERQGDPEAGAGYELTAIAIVVMGGTSLMGGRGGVGLTLLGMLTIGYMEKILSINAVPEYGRLVLTGAIIVAAVLTQRQR